MSSVPSLAWLNGEIVPWENAAVPLDDRGLQFGESLYEVIPVTAGRVRLLAEHVSRMSRAAEALGLDGGVPSPGTWDDLARRLIEQERLEEGLLYAQVTGGAAPRAFLPERKPRPSFFAYLMRRRFPRAAEAEKGIRAVTLPDTRWENAYLKTTMLLPSVLNKREAAGHGAQEALLVSPDGTVREGASSNLFVVDGGRILTPRSTRHVLPGITRPLVTSLVEQTGRTVSEKNIPAAELLDAQEVFITSTSQLVMGVTHLDGSPIGEGRPGTITLDLAARLRRRLELES